MINPTFSLVRENKSYINILHRNQYATFEDNSQNYFLGFSNKLNDHAALGISVYSQWSGVVQEFGFNANYATAVQLGAKSKLTFGTNITYYNTGLDKNRVIATEADEKILEARKESKVAIQPGVTLTVGKFDFGIYAENMFRYNQTTNNFVTGLNTKNLKASIQYTHTSMATRGLFANARLMPLVQLGKNEDSSLAYIGSLLFDLPKFGWLQANYDDTNGMSMGLGFNLSEKMSLGYLMEKDILQDNADLGWNHEITLAYTFKNNNGVLDLVDNSQDSKIDAIVRNYEEQILALTAENKKAKRKNKVERNTEVVEEADLNSLAYQNRLILDELILRQDSLETARNKEFEKKFEMIVKVLRNDIKYNLKAYKQDGDNGQTAVASNIEQPAATKGVNANTTVVENKIVTPTKANTVAVVPETHSESIAASQIEEVITERTPELAVNVSSDLAIAEVQEEAATNLNTVEHKEYVKLPIKILNQSDFVDVKSGYYVIANVYSNKKYLKAFMDSLEGQGFEPKQFFNKENGLYYVYLADYNFKEEAEMAYVSNLDGKYNDEKWIMQVDSHTATVANIYED
tara:strand:- start:1750 stop:3474 length:1725 start_codon:yes stop_codon:yes gene_type:complete